MTMKGELRSVRVAHGARCVMITGDLWMLKWSADNWDTHQRVTKSPANVFKCFPHYFLQEHLHSPLHILVRELVQLFWTMFTVMAVSPPSLTVTTTITRATVDTALMLESGVKVIGLQQ